ncbi:MAG: hypothetical protein HYX86_00290 [Chloroflexi bacterium]|nr:hypothetical protein [Chloroflexota bacterium]
MHKIGWFSLVLLVVVGLFLAACGGAAPPPPEVEPTATPTEEVVEETPQEEVAYQSNIEALQNLDSYSYSFDWSWEGGSAGAVTAGTFHGEGEVQNRPTRAQHIIFSTESGGSVSYTEWIYLETEGTLWTRDSADGEWQEVPGLDPSVFAGLDLTGLFFGLSYSTATDLQFTGVETINGVQANHFSSTTFSALVGFGCTVTEARDDIWVAVDGGFPVRQVSDFSGTCGGASAEWHFTLDVTGVNQPVQIVAPA